MLRNNSKRDPETQAGAVYPFRGVKRLEDVLQHLWRHSVTSVSDGDSNPRNTVIPKPGFARSNDETPANPHRIEGIADKIIENLTNISFVANNGPSATMLQLQSYIRIGKPPTIQAQRRFEKLLGSDRTRSGRLTMESQGVSRNLAHP